MSTFTYGGSALSPAEQALVPTPGYLPLLADEVSVAIEAGARVYGYLEEQACIVKLASEYDLERYSGRVTFAWTSNTTIADLVKRA